jgi:predicted ArsR family transcriptional regulator
MRWLAGIAEPVRLALVRRLASTGSATSAALAESCGASVTTVRRHLTALSAAGIVVEEAAVSDGCSTGRPASRYRLTYPVMASARNLFCDCFPPGELSNFERRRP